MEKFYKNLTIGRIFILVFLTSCFIATLSDILVNGFQPDNWSVSTVIISIFGGIGLPIALLRFGFYVGDLVVMIKKVWNKPIIS